MSLALDPTSMLIDSAAKLWQHLEQYAALQTRPQRCAFDEWLADVPATLHVDAADEQQLQRDYRRLCSLLDQLELVLRDGSYALKVVRAHVGDGAKASLS